jgi:hypothetical protein
MISCGTCTAVEGAWYDGRYDYVSLFTSLRVVSFLYWSSRSGGMPDDTTVVVMHVVGRDADDLMDSINM